MFHLLHLAIWNSCYMYKKEVNNKTVYLEFRDQLVKEYLGIPPNLKDGRKLVKTGLMHSGRRSKSKSDNHNQMHKI